MTNDFVIDKEKLKQLADKFESNEKVCEELFKLYEDVVSKSIRTQYLAHVIRSLELSLREMTGNGLFIIKCIPTSKENLIRNAVGKYHEGLCFIIYFNADLPEYEKRIVVAHELGHLFMVAFANQRFKKVKYSGQRKMYGDGHYMEPLASLFGIFAISAKNQFYQNDAQECAAKITSHGWDGLIDDFLKLKDEQ